MPPRASLPTNSLPTNSLAADSFWLTPLAYAHRSWVERAGLPPVTYPPVRGGGRLNGMLLARLGLSPVRRAVAEPLAALLTVADGGTLAGLVERAGACVVNRAVRTAIGREQRETIEAALPGAALTFINRSAVLLWPGGPLLPVSLASKSALVQGLLANGMAVLRAVLSAEHPETVSRLLLKLPRSWSEAGDAAGAAPEAARTLLRKLMAEGGR